MLVPEAVTVYLPSFSYDNSGVRSSPRFNREGRAGYSKTLDRTYLL